MRTALRILGLAGLVLGSWAPLVGIGLLVYGFAVDPNAAWAILSGWLLLLIFLGVSHLIWRRITAPPQRACPPDPPPAELDEIDFDYGRRAA